MNWLFPNPFENGYKEIVALIRIINKNRGELVMLYGNENYEIEKSADGGTLAGASSPHSLSIRKKIQHQIQRLNEEVARLEEMIKLLDENPAIERFQDLSSRVRI